MNTLFLQLSPHESPPHGESARAWLGNAAGIESLGEQALATLAAQYRDAAAVAFIPSSRCLFTTVNATAQQRRQAGQALGWLIEEQTGEDADALHVIAAAGDNEEQTCLLAINQEELRQWQDRLKAQGLHVMALLPDLFLLPKTQEAGWRLATSQGDMLALRTGDHAGAVLEADLLPAMLSAALQEKSEAPAAIFVATESLLAAVQPWAEAQNIPTKLDTSLNPETAFATVADWTRHPANFLQGSFAISRQFSLPRGLRVAAGFVAAAIAVQLLGDWMHYGYYQYQARKTETAATALYRQMYPEERRIVNLRRQLQAHLNENRGQDSALTTLTRLAESLQGTGLNAQRVDFNSGVLTLDVDARALGDLDSFRQKLEGQGFRSEIVSANAQGGVIRGRLRVEGGA